MRRFVIDYENVGDSWLRHVYGSADAAILVWSSGHGPKSMPTGYPMLGHWETVTGPKGCQAADLAVAAILGAQLHEFPSDSFVLLSGDTGFVTLVGAFRACGYDIRQLDRYGVPVAATAQGANAFDAALAATRPKGTLPESEAAVRQDGPVGFVGDASGQGRPKERLPQQGRGRDSVGAREELIRDSIRKATGSVPTAALVHALALKRDNAGLSKALQASIRDPSKMRVVMAKVRL